VDRAGTAPTLGLVTTTAVGSFVDVQRKRRQRGLCADRMAVRFVQLVTLVAVIVLLVFVAGTARLAQPHSGAAAIVAVAGVTLMLAARQPRRGRW